MTAQLVTPSFHHWYSVPLIPCPFTIATTLIEFWGFYAQICKLSDHDYRGLEKLFNQIIAQLASFLDYRIPPNHVRLPTSSYRLTDSPSLQDQLRTTLVRHAPKAVNETILRIMRYQTASHKEKKDIVRTANRC